MTTAERIPWVSSDISNGGFSREETTMRARDGIEGVLGQGCHEHSPFVWIRDGEEAVCLPRDPRAPYGRTDVASESVRLCFALTGTLRLLCATLDAVIDLVHPKNALHHCAVHVRPCRRGAMQLKLRMRT